MGRRTWIDVGGGGMDGHSHSLTLNSQTGGTGFGTDRPIPGNMP